MQLSCGKCWGCGSVLVVSGGSAAAGVAHTYTQCAFKTTFVLCRCAALTAHAWLHPCVYRQVCVLFMPCTGARKTVCVCVCVRARDGCVSGNLSAARSVTCSPQHAMNSHAWAAPRAGAAAMNTCAPNGAALSRTVQQQQRQPRAHRHPAAAIQHTRTRTRTHHRGWLRGCHAHAIPWRCVTALLQCPPLRSARPRCGPACRSL
jgi:hypothetical protein